MQPRGLLSNPTQVTPQSGGFNGTVNVEGQNVQVQGGIASFMGEQFLVSNDGSMVVDSKMRIIGHVDSGKFMPMTPEYAKELAAKGLTQGAGNE